MGAHRHTKTPIATDQSPRLTLRHLYSLRHERMRCQDQGLSRMLEWDVLGTKVDSYFWDIDGGGDLTAEPHYRRLNSSE